MRRDLSCISRSNSDRTPLIFLEFGKTKAARREIFLHYGIDRASSATYEQCFCPRTSIHEELV